MIDYGIVKTVHVAAVVLSGVLFAARGAWRFARPDATLPRPARVLPHAVDTVLLLSALVLASFWLRGKLPLDWIGAKVIVLAGYVALGIVALRPGLAPGRRAIALVAAVLAYGYIVGVALSKSPAGPLRWLAVPPMEGRYA